MQASVERPTVLTPVVQCVNHPVAESSTLRTINVLLVDDQEIVGKVLQRLLATESDIALCYCRDPQQALQFAIKQVPTVILLDLVMPEIDGLLLLRWLKLHSATRDIPVVMLSAEEAPELKAKAFSQGANDYLIKPPDAPELIARIRYHARSYRNFKGLVAATHLAQAQSQQLKQTLQTLQATQAQLIQAEKLAGLEQLVAGMAHEINNPINFIYGNLAHAQEYTDHLLNIVQLHQQRCPLSCDKVYEQPNSPDLEFITEDLPKVLGSMKVGAERIRQIILSLRQFSHLDQAALKAVNLHAGIDSTLLILQHQLMATPNYAEIEVVKDYSNVLPPVECYPALLNQVFMHVLSNAIDAIENRRQQTGKTYQGQIRIHTALELDERSMAVIEITDNGCGMTESVQSQIFDPFFTTKPIGKGTGLGLSSSYQVIVNQHNGVIKCTSIQGEGTVFWIKIPLHVQRES
jgi:signal transduction histidine kinase